MIFLLFDAQSIIRLFIFYLLVYGLFTDDLKTDGEIKNNKNT